MTNGLLLLDKPLGLSSSAATQRVRRLLGGVKAGHVGSLDPLATGMLPICLGETTKLAGAVLEGDKVYRFTVALGARTSTGDAEGEIVERQPVPVIDTAHLQAVLTSFLGESQQVPPMYSAIKQGGQPLYKLARAGKTVERAPRSIRIQRLTALPVGDTLHCEVECGKGTYVRVLAEDMARALGTVGHVTALRREQVQPFPASAMRTLGDLEQILATGGELPLLGPTEVLPQLKRVDLDPARSRQLLHGQGVEVEGEQYDSGELLLLFGPEEQFLGLGSALGGGRIAPKRLVAAGVSG